MSAYGNRSCTHDGCTTNGGSAYMDTHEALPHGRCACGWIGATRNFPWHLGQRIRHSPRPDAERPLHFLTEADPMVTEAIFQIQLIELAHVLGWHHLHVRRTIGKGRRWTTATNVVGWPDLLMWHERQRRILATELKSDSGQPSEEQLAVLASLAAAGIETHLWRPRDWDTIVRTLSPKKP